MSRGRRAFLIGVLAVATVPVVYVLTRPSGRTLTRERLDEARARWKANGPRNYVLEVEARGARHKIEVKDAEVVAMTTGGNPVVSGAHLWSVEGLFGFLSQELSNLQRPESAYGVSDPLEVVLRAEFDARYGYPSLFLRHVSGRTRSDGFRVLSFEPR
jgi:hypothetical protein